jgi:hypothetical protein
LTYDFRDCRFSRSKFARGERTLAKAMTAALITVLVLAAAGCGDGGGGDQTVATTESPVQKEEERAEAEAPKGASPVLRQIYRQFPPPQPDPAVKGSAEAIQAGERACRGKTPLEVREEFIAESDLLEPQAELVAELPKLERSAATNGAFVTGQLGALVYERTLPERVASYGYQGCVYSLALVIKRKLAPR